MAVTVKLGEKKVWKVNVGVASNGTKDHNKLENRDAENQHPMSSISGLDKALGQKAPSSHQHKKADITDFPESLPASDVYDWAKKPQKPSYTASEVGARPNTWLPTLEQIGAAPALDWSHLKWYVMGDSLTDRNASHTDKYYYDFVQEKTGIQVIVDGIGGTGYGAGASNSESYYDRVQNIPDDVDIVTIFGSGNDIRFAESANMEIYNTLSWLALNKPGLRVIVVPPAPWLGYNKREDPWKAYCDRLQACASVCNFRYVSDMYDCPPFNPNFTGHMEVFFTTDPEGIHPDENGHKVLAPYFYNALLEELALDESVVISPGGSGGSGGAVDIPSTLPNPHKLTFTGAVTAEYDGSKEVTVKIPEGGSGGGNVYFNHFSTLYTVTAEDVANYTAGDEFIISVDGLSGYARIATIRLGHPSATGGSVLNKCVFVPPDPQNKYKAYRREHNAIEYNGKTIKAWNDFWATYILTEQQTNIKASGVTGISGGPAASQWKGSYWADASVYPLTSFCVSFQFDTLVEGLQLELHVIEEVSA